MSEVCPFYNKELKKTPCPQTVTHIVTWWDSEIWYVCDHHANQCRKEMEEIPNYIMGVWTIEQIEGRKLSWNS